MPKLEGGAEPGDYVVADLTFTRDGTTLNEVKEIQFRLQPDLRFQDGVIPDLAKALTGAKPGEARKAEAQIGTSSPDPTLRGQAVEVTIAGPRPEDAPAARGRRRRSSSRSASTTPRT